MPVDLVSLALVRGVLVTSAISQSGSSSRLSTIILTLINVALALTTVALALTTVALTSTTSGLSVGRLIVHRSAASNWSAWVLLSSSGLSVRLLLGFIRGSFLSELSLGLLVPVADQSVEVAVWSAKWVLVTFLLMIFDFLVDISLGILVGRGVVIV